LFLNSGQLNQIVLYYVDDEYRSLHPGLATGSIRDESSLMRALRIAETNGLLYPFCKKLLEESHMKEKSGLIETKIRIENKRILFLKKTLSVTEKLFKKENLDFLFIKLYRGVPYTPRDVDVLIRHEDLPSAISLFRKNGFDVQAFSDVEIQCQREDLLKVDLYCGFYYLSLPFVDDELLWRDCRIVDMYGFDCPIPGFEADFLSTVIHSLLGHRRLSLLDFLYAKSLLNSERLSFDTMLKEAEKYGWADAFNKVFHTLKDLHKSLYSSENFPKGIRFPLVYSTKFVFEIFQGFAGFNVDTRTKFLFALSAFLDATYHKYLYVGQTLPLEIPKQLKNVINRSLYKVRRLRGDRKTNVLPIE